MSIKHSHDVPTNCFDISHFQIIGGENSLPGEFTHMAGKFPNLSFLVDS